MRSLNYSLLIIIFTFFSCKKDKNIINGCTDSSAANYNPYAIFDDGSCLTGGCTIQIACNYDPDATLYNAFMCEYPESTMFNCDGSCTNDVDGDEICDEEDPCIGEYDDCGVCNGPGAIYECGCSDIPLGDCDCDGNLEEAIGICGG